MTRRNVHVHASVQLQVGQLRTASFEGREHLVVPVIALREGVLHAVNAPYPELVLEEVFGKTPGGWNGEPVLGDHPSDGDERVSANDPAILESLAFGRIFNAKVEDKSLKVEAWIDPDRAKAAGHARTVERLVNGEVVEVSVGAFVVDEPRSGIWQGKKYGAVWKEVVPDHLALLPEGTTGACSVEMGCGAPRTAQCFAEDPPTAGKEDEGMTQKADPPAERTLRERIASIATVRDAAAPEDMSDQDLRSALSGAISAVERDFAGIDAVYPASGKVVYAVFRGDTFLLLRRGFTVAEDGAVSLEDDSEEVKPVMSYEPVKAAADCGCGGEHNDPAPTKEENVDRKQAVAALIANTTVPWTEADEPFLMELSDERFSAFSGCADTIARNALVVGELEQQLEAAKAPEPKTEAQWLEAAPDSIKALVKKYQAQEREEHDQLVLALTEAQDVYSKEELAAMSSEQLEKLTKIAVGKKAALQDHADFSGRVPRQPDDGEAETAPPPIDMTERIKAARSA